MIRGNPLDGSIVVYNGAEGRFHLLGSTIMTVAYSMYSDELFSEAHHVKFWARLEWKNSAAEVVEIRSSDDDRNMPPVEKTDPLLTKDEAFPVVRRFFEKCFETKKAPMPPGCPETTVINDHVSWKLHGDPTLNASMGFDRETGLVKVTGDYSATASYNVFLLGPTTTPLGGRYSASIAIDGSKPNVLTIENE